MKYNILRISTAVLFLYLSQNMYADKCYTTESNKSIHLKKINAESCAPATGTTDLNINNVRARINTGGDMWWDLQGNPKYEIPKGSQKNSMFSAALWIGGTDVNGQLKVAALRYRQNGNDYWTGPLTTDGTAAVDAETCKKYDRHYTIYRSDVDQFIAWFKDKASYPNYKIPKNITDYPAHGDISKGQSYYLAPFYDNNHNGKYDPEDGGDYPYYDVDNSLCHSYKKTAEGNGILEDQVLKGDQTLWWVFNDKGNIHTESNGQSIGMEIRAQAFAFATNDEINNMTFYSYEVINRSTYRLKDTYFSQWVDTDLGDPQDDYVGCDVAKGLGYCYNGKEVDGTGMPKHYGSQPPAIGVDFFQGPYLDPDGLDNPKGGCDLSINGVNFGDGIIDNERFGMRRFVYHNNGGPDPAITDPDKASEYYNYLRGIWKDGLKMRYGGNAHTGKGVVGPDCDFMFPGTTDPCDWGTGGKPPAGNKDWTEKSSGNIASDRRFMQSAGPFTLEPGAVNYITVGIPWARATSGGAWGSVELLKQVDIKCQQLFDNCFKVVNGPDAPDLAIQELDKELILFISNKKGANVNGGNFNEAYIERDPSIIATSENNYDPYYKFQGYQIFQLKDATVSIADIHNPDLARMIAQCDIKDSVTQLVNFTYNDKLGANIPVEEVNGANKGIVHSFRIFNDEFSSGDKRLVNNKQYYFVAVAYAYNQYKKYDPNDPQYFDGQKKPYLAGRKTSVGGPIRPVTAIPHNPAPENNGTVMNSIYGYGPKITRIEGQGNGGNVLDLTAATIDNIMSSSNGKSEVLEYENGKGPISIKIIDPLNVKKGNFILKFDPNTYHKNAPTTMLDTAHWTLYNADNPSEFYTSDKSIGLVKTYLDLNTNLKKTMTASVENEQLFLDLGFSVTIKQCSYTTDKESIENEKNGFLEATMKFSDSTKQWLSAVPDNDSRMDMNWIRSGTLSDVNMPGNNDYNLYFDLAQAVSADAIALDPKESFEKVLGGTWAPYVLTAKSYNPIMIKGGKVVTRVQNGPQWWDQKRQNDWFLPDTTIRGIASVDIIITNDKSKWTRSPVIEMCENDNTVLSEGNRSKFQLRARKSVDINGNQENSDTMGLGWFPGYAINVETGERLNIMFGEDSWLQGENGRDLKWNPTSNFYTNLGEALWGGKHYIYIMGHNKDGVNDCPAYDKGKYIYSKLSKNNFAPAYSDMLNVYKDAMWVNIPILARQQNLLACDVKIRIRVAKPYNINYSTSGSKTPQNKNYPMYSFSTSGLETVSNDLETAKSAMDLINVVPNPYYAYAGYEENQLDTRVRITNLPPKCTVSIFTSGGVLVRQFKLDKSGIAERRTPITTNEKFEATTSIDWDLKNFANIPISGGVYLIHVKADGYGDKSEKVIKWFGILRPTDLNSF